MTHAALLALLGGGCAVLAVWEVLCVAHATPVPPTVARTLAPLRLAARSGREATVAERRRLGMLATATGLASGWLLAGLAAGLAVAVGGPLIVTRTLAARRARWRRELANGAPAVARSLADALAAGHSVRSAFVAAATDGGLTGAPGRELAAAGAALRLGEPTDVVLGRLRDRAQTPGWNALIAAILLCGRAGGDLAGLLRTIAVTQEEARRVEADARTLTAQARFTAQLVVGLPLAAAALAELGSPGLLLDLASAPLTALMLAGSLLLQGFAMVIVRRIGRGPMVAG